LHKVKLQKIKYFRIRLYFDSIQRVIVYQDQSVIIHVIIFESADNKIAPFVVTLLLLTMILYIKLSLLSHGIAYYTYLTLMITLIDLMLCRIIIMIIIHLNVNNFFTCVNVDLCKSRKKSHR